MNKQTTSTSDYHDAYRLGGDDVLLPVLVETGDTFDGHVVCFRCTGSEYDVFWFSPDEIGHMLYEIV